MKTVDLFVNTPAFVSVALTSLILTISASVHADSAFGIHFSKEVPTDVIGQELVWQQEKFYSRSTNVVLTSASEPLPSADTKPSHLWDQWFELLPQIVPQIFQERRASYQIQLDQNLQPVRVFAHIESPKACSVLMPAAQHILLRKYPDADSLQAPDASELRTSFTHNALLIELECFPTSEHVLLKYTHSAALDDWKTYQKAELERWNQEQRSYQNLKLAELLSPGKRYQLSGGLGLNFDRPMKTLTSFQPDIAFSVDRSLFLDELNLDEYHLVLSPEGKPYKIIGLYHMDNQIDAIEKMKNVFDAFAEKYGTAIKDRPRHKIFKVSSDFIVQKLITPASVELSFIQQNGIRLQRERKRNALALEQEREQQQLLLAEEKAHRKAQIAKDRAEEEQRRWEESTLGL